MLDKNLSVSISMVLLTNTLAAENRSSMSLGDPQNWMEPLPNRRRELFLLTDMDGLMDNLVDPCEVTDMVTPIDETTVSEWLAIMVTVSGVIARWTSLVSLVWRLNPNKVELRLQVEHTESIPFTLPMSNAALHTIQPAHLPLISLSILTTVEWVVMDMGSIHSSSLE